MVAEREQQRQWAADLIVAAKLVAERLGAGGRLVAVGPGRAAPDARHIAVEFLHPVIVGKPALPALVGVDAVPDRDAVVAVAYEGAVIDGPVDVAISDRPLSQARVTIAIPPAGAKHAAVVSYHVLWELVHVFLEAGQRATTTSAAIESLYPMLYGNGRQPDGDLDESAVASVIDKLGEADAVLARALVENDRSLDAAAEIFATAPMVYTFGNGGSATDAEDLAHLLSPRSTAISSDNATVTALANDVGFDVVLARPLATLARPGDAVVGLSTSGTSANVIAGLRHGAANGLATVGFAGYGGGAMTDLGLDALLVVRSDSVHRIQEAQVGLYCEAVSRARALVG